MQTAGISSLSFTKDSDIFLAFQKIWNEELGEELSYERAEEYGPAVLAIVASVARSK